MRRQLLPSLGMMLIFTVITGLLYPLLVTGLAQAGFSGAANGSLVERDGEVIGSAWIGQPFTQPEYFHPRPAADGYVAGVQGGGTYSYGSNYGPTNDTLLEGVHDAALAYREENGLDDDALVPVDAVTASGSGLDPEISVANARIQAARVAEERDLDLDQVLRLVDEHTAGRDLGFLGEPGVNVLELNLALDGL
jgi:K+-transporting ATPase ATPase C chain